MKIHVGVDATTGYVHTITATAANVYDSQEMTKLVRETMRWYREIRCTWAQRSKREYTNV